MARRTRLTPFARFILVMIIVAPLAYLGASYFNGEDGIQNLKELVGLSEPAASPDQSPETVTTTSPESSPDIKAEPETDAAEPPNEALQERYRNLEKENLDLKQKLREKELEIQELKRRIRLLEGSTE